MKKETKELLEWSDKLSEKIVEVSVKYERAIGKLKEASDSFKNEKKGFLGQLISLSPLIIIILFILFAVYYLNFSPCGSVGYGDFKISKECQKK